MKHDNGQKLQGEGQCRALEEGGRLGGERRVALLGLAQFFVQPQRHLLPRTKIRPARRG